MVEKTSTWSLALDIAQVRGLRVRGARMAMLCAALSLGAACSKDLNRDHAAELVKSNQEFKTSYDYKIAVGSFWFDWRNIDSAYDYQPLVAVSVRRARRS